MFYTVTLSCRNGFNTCRPHWSVQPSGDINHVANHCKRETLKKSYVYNNRKLICVYKLGQSFSAMDVLNFHPGVLHNYRNSRNQDRHNIEYPVIECHQCSIDDEDLKNYNNTPQVYKNRYRGYKLVNEFGLMS